MRVSGDEELGGAAKIGAREIYDLVVATKEAVEKLDGRLDRHGDHLEIHDERLDDHENRLRAVERRRFASPAQWASMVLAFLAVAVAVIALFVQH